MCATATHKFRPGNKDDKCKQTAQYLYIGQKSLRAIEEAGPLLIYTFETLMEAVRSLALSGKNHCRGKRHTAHSWLV